VLVSFSFCCLATRWLQPFRKDPSSNRTRTTYRSPYLYRRTALAPPTLLYLPAHHQNKWIRANLTPHPGLTVQRKSHVQEDLLPPALRRKPIRRPLWLLGFTIYITSNVFSTIFQLDALPIVILAPLGAVSLIFNALLARIILGDVFGRQSAVGTGLVALGAVLIAVFGVVEEKEHSLDDLLALWERPMFLIFFSTVGAVTLLVLIAVSRATVGR